MNRILLSLIVTTFLGLSLGPSGCGRDEDPLDPPTIHLGEDMCSICSMIISDRRYAGAIVMRRDGRVERLIFDDIGEMVAHDPPTNEAIRWYVHDGTTEQWIPAEAAKFLLSPDLLTPMATGVVAFSTDAAAAEAKRNHGGEVYDFDGIRAARSEE